MELVRTLPTARTLLLRSKSEKITLCQSCIFTMSYENDIIITMAERNNITSYSEFQRKLQQKEAARFIEKLKSAHCNELTEILYDADSEHFLDYVNFLELANDLVNRQPIDLSGLATDEKDKRMLEEVPFVSFNTLVVAMMRNTLQGAAFDLHLIAQKVFNNNPDIDAEKLCDQIEKNPKIAAEILLPVTSEPFQNDVVNNFINHPHTRTQERKNSARNIFKFPHRKGK